MPPIAPSWLSPSVEVEVAMAEEGLLSSRFHATVLALHADKAHVQFHDFTQEGQQGGESEVLLTEWVPFERLRPLPPPPPSGFLSTLKVGTPLESLLKDGWWDVTLDAIDKQRRSDFYRVGSSAYDTSRWVDQTTLRPRWTFSDGKWDSGSADAAPPRTAGGKGKADGDVDEEGEEGEGEEEEEDGRPMMAATDPDGNDDEKEEGTGRCDDRRGAPPPRYDESEYGPERGGEEGAPRAIGLTAGASGTFHCRKCGGRKVAKSSQCRAPCPHGPTEQSATASTNGASSSTSSTVTTVSSTVNGGRPSNDADDERRAYCVRFVRARLATGKCTRAEILRDFGVVNGADEAVRAGDVEQLGHFLYDYVSARWPVGADVECLDCRQVWTAARVIGERGYALGHEVHLHYKRWNVKWDEWLLSRSYRIRPPSGSATAAAAPSRAAAAATRPLDPNSMSAAEILLAEANAADAAAAEAAATAERFRAAAAAAATSAASEADDKEDDMLADDDASAAAGGSMPSSTAPGCLACTGRHRPHTCGTVSSSPVAPCAPAVAPRAPAVAPRGGRSNGRGGGDGGGGRGRGRGGRADGQFAQWDDAPLASGGPPLSRVMSDGDRVRHDAMQFDDGVYERCGTFGCILENKHNGVHIFPAPPKRRRG